MKDREQRTCAWNMYMNVTERIIIWRTVLSLTLSFSAGFPLFSTEVIEKPVSLFRNSNFETDLKDGWNFVTHNQDALVKAGIDVSDRAEGNSSLKVMASGALNSYVAVSQTILFRKGTPMPDAFEVSHKNTGTGATVLVRALIHDNGKAVWKYKEVPLSSSNGKWVISRFELSFPENIEQVAVEIRVSKQGTFWFDRLRFISGAEKPLAFLLLIPEKKNGAPDDLPPYLKRGLLPGGQLKNTLEKQGFQIGIAKYSPELTLDYLKKFNIVILGCEGESGQRSVSGKEKEKLFKELLEYVREGGSLLIFRTPGWCFDSDINFFNELLNPAGIRILPEQITDRTKLLKTISGAKFYWTDNITPHEITKGVSGFFYPDIFSDGYAAYTDFTSPVQAGPDWKILIRGAKTASSFSRAKGQPLHPEKPGSYSSEPPFLAVRDYGLGKIAVMPVATSCFWQDGFHLFWERGALMDGKVHEKPGNGLLLMENLFSWLSTPSRGKFGGYVSPIRSQCIEEGFQRIDWDKAHLTGKNLPNCYVGLIGAQSSLSSGTASPLAMIHAARESGYAFLAFTEDLSKMNPAKFEELKKICRENSSEKFRAFPGFHYLDESGNAWAVFSDKLFFPKAEWFSKKYPERLSVNNPSTRGWGWPPVILLQSHKNPEKPYLQGNFNTFATQTYENGKLTDESRDNYQHLLRSSFVFSPVAVHFVTTPEAVRSARKEGWQTAIRWAGNNAAEALTGTGFGSTLDGKLVYFRPSFVTEGPIIDDFRILNFGMSDLAIPGNDKWRMRIAASSPDGLKEIRIVEADKPGVFRRFLPNGARTFEAEIDGWHNQGCVFLMEVTDAKGKRALSWRAPTIVQENSFLRCSDNFNTMPRGKWWGQPEHLQNIRGFENYLVNRDFVPTGTVRIDGTGKDTLLPAGEYVNSISSRFGTIYDYRYSEHYPVDKGGNDDLTDLKELALPNDIIYSRVLYTFFTCRQPSSLIYLVEGTIKVLKDFNAWEIRVYSNHARRNSDKLSYTLPDRTVRNTVLNASTKHVSGEIPESGFAVLYPDSFNGSFGFISLMKGMSFTASVNSDLTHYFLNGFIRRDNQQYKAGDVLQYRYLAVTSKLDPTPNDRFVRDVVENLGIGGKPAYHVIPENGSVESTEFILRLCARNNAWNGVITRTELPLNLPVMISGLNPNWDAGILYRGKNKLLIPEWIVNEYQERFIRMTPKEYTDELYHIPVLENGTGMLQVDTEFGDRNIFIGNLLTADNTDIRLTLLDSRPGKQAFEAHNPTDKPITCTVKPGKGFGLLGEFTRKITVQAGSSLRVTLQ